MSTGRLDSRDLAAQLLNSEYLYLRLNSGWLGMVLVYALRMAKALPHISPQQIALTTMLGNAGLADRKAVVAALKQVFGLQQGEPEDGAEVGAACF